MKKEILTRLINLLLMALTVAKFSHHLYLLVKKRCLEFAANIKYCRRLKRSIVSESIIMWLFSGMCILAGKYEGLKLALCVHHS